MSPYPEEESRFPTDSPLYRICEIRTLPAISMSKIIAMHVFLIACPQYPQYARLCRSPTVSVSVSNYCL